MALDKGDLLMCSWGDSAEADRPEWRLDTEESIRDAFAEWREKYHLFAILWRQERWLARFAEIEPVSRRERQLYETVHNVDDARVATSAAKDVGIPIYCYVDVYDEGQPPHRPGFTHGVFDWQSKFFAQHPEYYACDRNWEKKQWGVPEYAYPEVRQYKREELRYFLDNYDWDGVYISTRGHRIAAEHGDQYGFNRPVADAFRERYGVDILTENFDLEAWRRLRGEFLTQYFRDVRELVNERGLKLMVGVPPGDHFGPPIGNLFLEWRKWIEERIVDGIVVGHANVVGKHVQTGYGYVSSYFHGEWGLPPLPELLEEEYGPLCEKNQVRLWAGLQSRARLAREYGKIYTNEMLRAVPNVTGLQWSIAGKGDWMLTMTDWSDDPTQQ